MVHMLLRNVSEEQLKKLLFKIVAVVVQRMDIFLKIRNLEFARSLVNHTYKTDEDPVKRLFTTDQAWSKGKLFVLCYPR